MSDSSGLLSVTTPLSKPLSHFIAYLTACTPGESLADFCMIDRSEFRHICGPPSLVLRKRQSFICLTPQLDKSMLTIIMRMSNVQCSLLARGCHHRLSAVPSNPPPSNPNKSQCYYQTFHYHLSVSTTITLSSNVYPALSQINFLFCLVTRPNINNPTKEIL